MKIAQFSDKVIDDDIIQNVIWRQGSIIIYSKK